MQHSTELVRVLVCPPVCLPLLSAPCAPLQGLPRSSREVSVACVHHRLSTAAFPGLSDVRVPWKDSVSRLFHEITNKQKTRVTGGNSGTKGERWCCQ